MVHRHRLASAYDMVDDYYGNRRTLSVSFRLSYYRFRSPTDGHSHLRIKSHAYSSPPSARMCTSFTPFAQRRRVSSRGTIEGQVSSMRILLKNSRRNSSTRLLVCMCVVSRQTREAERQDITTERAAVQTLKQHGIDADALLRTPEFIRRVREQIAPSTRRSTAE